MPLNDESQPTVARPRLLVVSPASIMPMIHGGAVRMGNLFRRLAEHFEIFVLVMIGGTDDPVQRAALEATGVTPLFQQFPSDAGHPSARLFFSPLIVERIRALVDAHEIDIVQLEYTELAEYAEPLARTVPVVLVEMDVTFRSLERQRRSDDEDREGWAALPADESRRLELAACEAADLVHVMSPADCAFLAERLSDGTRRLRVVPNGVDVDTFEFAPWASRRRQVLFLGSFPHRPNRQALRWFATEVWPEVLHLRPDAHLTVAGARPPQWVLELDGRDNVSVEGEVDDVRPLYRDHRVLVAPLLSGSGTRLKILEAAASGLPVVSTTIGAEGLDFEPDREISIADSAPAFATAVVDLLDTDSPPKIAAAARAKVCDRYAWNAVAEHAETTYRELLAARPPSRRSAPTIISHSPSPPDVSIVLHGRSRAHDLRPILDQVELQRADRGVEFVWAADGPPPEIFDRFPHPVIVAGPGPGACRGRQLNAGAGAATAPILLFLAARSRPATESWFSTLIDPLEAANAPTAVQGGVAFAVTSRGTAFDLHLPSEGRHWLRNSAGILASADNLAVLRERWFAHPFVTGSGQPDLRWQRQIQAARQLILPCLQSVVRLEVNPAAPRTLARWIAEGRGWEALGEPYRFADWVADVRLLLTGGDRRRSSRRFLPILTTRGLALVVGGLRRTGCYDAAIDKTAPGAP